MLHLPLNVASQISASVRGLRSIGIDAHGLIERGVSDTFQSSAGIEILPPAPSLPRSLRWAAAHTVRYRHLLSAIASADVLHWHFGELVLHKGLDLRWARLLRKPGVTEFWGSDIRIAEIEASDNPYFSRCVPEDYQRQQTREHSLCTQMPFANAGFECAVADDAMKSYVQPDLFSKVHIVRQRVVTADYSAAPPGQRSRRPLIVHSPSNPKLKGTEFVLAAVEHLRSRMEFDFRLIQNMPREEALAVLERADIFVDQVILGSYGLAAVEAMALGKPVICYIKPTLVGTYPEGMPIVSANPDNLTEVLGELISDRDRCHELGVRGRSYVEMYHDAAKIAEQLKTIYQSLMN